MLIEWNLYQKKKKNWFDLEICQTIVMGKDPLNLTNGVCKKRDRHIKSKKVKRISV